MLVLLLLLLMFLLLLVLFLLLFLLFGFFAALRSAGRRSSGENPCTVHPPLAPHPFFQAHPTTSLLCQRETHRGFFGDDSERCKTSPLPNRAMETFCKIFPTKSRAFLVVSHQTGRNPHRFSSTFSSFSCFFLEPDVSGLLETLWC